MFKFFLLLIVITQTVVAGPLAEIKDCQWKSAHTATWNEAMADRCAEKAVAFANKNKKNAGLTYDAALYVAKNYSEAYSARIMKITASQDKSYCSKQYTRVVTLQALRSTKDDGTSEAGLELANLCFDSMKEALKTALNERYKPMMKRICPLLTQKRAIGSLQKKRCQKYSK